MPRALSVPRGVAIEAAAVVFGFLGLAIAWTWPLALRPGTTMAAPFGDPLLNAWILGWDADRLRHGLAGLWTAPPFYPLPDTLAYSEHLLGVAVPLAPLAWLTGNPVLVYNVALIGSFALAGAGMYLLARGLTGRRDVAVLAGLAFACCPYRAPQITHLQVLMNGWMPIALWALHRAFATGSRRALAGFVLAFLAQALTNGYLLFFLAVPVALVTVVELIRHRAQVRTHVVHLAFAALAIGIVLAPVAASYLRVKHEQGLARTRGDAVQFGARPGDYARVSGQPWLWSRLLPIGTPEKELFPGLTVVLLALCVLIPSRQVPGVLPTPEPSSSGPPSSTIALYASIALIAFVLSMGPEPALSADFRLPSGPWAWLSAIVPGFDGLRVPARFAVVVYVALAALASIGAARLLARLASPATRLAIVAVLALAIVADGYAGALALERVPSAEMAVDRVVYEWLATQPRGPMLELPMGKPDPAVRYQYRTLVHGNRIVNGYSGYGTALEEFLGGPPFTEIDGAGEALAAVRQLGVRYVVVHGQLYADHATARRVIDGLAAEAAQIARTTTFGPVAVFELRPAAPAPLPKPAGTEIPASAVRLSASHNAGALPAVVDGNPATRWLTGIPQDGSEWLRLDFDRPRRVGFVRIVMDRRSFGDYPRRLEIEGSSDGQAFRTLWAGPVIVPFAASLVELPVMPRIDLALPGADAIRALRLRQTGRTPRRWYWSVHEIRLWE